MRSIVFLVFGALPFLATMAAAQCPPQGLGLSVAGGRVGDPFSVSLTGTAGVSGLLGVDAAAGPVATSVGTVCLGVSGALQTVPFTLSATGSWSWDGLVPPNPALSGMTAFLQAVGLDPVLRGGFALSNGATATLVPPRLWIINPGPVNQYGAQQAGSLCGYDALTDTVATPAIPLASYVVHFISIPHLGLVAVLLGNNSIVVLNASTGATVLNIAVPGSPSGPAKKLAATGNVLYVLSQGMVATPIFAGTPTTIRGYSLQTGALLSTLTPPGAQDDLLLIVPGTSVAYLRTLTLVGQMVMAAGVLPVDLATGQALAPINLGTSCGSLQDWTLLNGNLYCLMGGFNPGPFTTLPILPPGMNCIDTSTHTAAYATPIPLGGASTSAFTLRVGPGIAPTPSLFARAGLQLVEIAPFNLATINVVTLPPNLSVIEPSPGGTEWLLLCVTAVGAAPTLEVMSPPAFAPTVVATLPTSSHYTITVLPSATLRKAYVAWGPAIVASFPTDPAGPIATTAALPVSGVGAQYKYLVE